MNNEKIRDEDAILANNQMIDRQVVEASKRLESELTKLGVVFGTSYGVEPPLGSGIGFAGSFSKAR